MNPRAEPGRYTSCVSVQGNDDYPIHRAITKDLVAVGEDSAGVQELVSPLEAAAESPGVS